MKFNSIESFAKVTSFPCSSSFKDRIVSEWYSRRGYQAGVSSEAREVNESCHGRWSGGTATKQCVTVSLGTEHEARERRRNTPGPHAVLIPS